MTSKITLNVGDIVTVKSAPALSLVVRSDRVVSTDAASGESRWVDEIDLVDIAEDRWGKPTQTIQYTDPKVRRLYLEGSGGMCGKGKPINSCDIKVVGTCSLSTYVTTTHVMDNVKYYGNI